MYAFVLTNKSVTMTHHMTHLCSFWTNAWPPIILPLNDPILTRSALACILLMFHKMKRQSHILFFLMPQLGRIPFNKVDRYRAFKSSLTCHNFFFLQSCLFCSCSEGHQLIHEISMSSYQNQDTFL